MSLQTPALLVLQTSNALDYQLHGDGSVTFSFALPDFFDATKPHALKLLFLTGAKQTLLCSSNLVAPQALDGELRPLLGTSNADSNVYIPVRTNLVAAVGELNIRPLDGEKLSKLENLVMALHLVPTNELALWGHR